MPEYKLGEGPYGSAYQGTIDDLFASGDLTPIEIGDRSFGLFLGQFDWEQTVRQVWKEPARGLWGWLTKSQVNRDHVETLAQTQDLRFTGDAHHLIVANSGAGKFRDVLSNMLLYDGSCETACLIIDPKGEIASKIGPFIDRPRSTEPRTAILDPWDLCGTGGTEALTLLDGIRSDNPHCVKDARVLAEAIIVDQNESDGHWVATARNFMAALLLYVGLDPVEKDARTLFRVRQIVTQPWDDLVELLGYLSDNTLFEGLIARAARAMLNRSEKERRTILSTLERDTAFIEDPALWKAIKSSSFDMNQLVLTNKRLHVIVPFDYTEQMKSWLRLTIAAFYNACLRNRLSEELPRYLQFRHIIIDEFAGLGKLDFIMKGIAEARGAGLKYHLAVQNFPQLKATYGEGWENLVSNSFIHAFGVNENFTADYLSKMTGQATVVTESKGYSSSTTKGTSSTRGSSSSSGPGGSTSGSSSSTSTSESTTTGSSITFSSVGRPVLMPDEIRRLSETQQLLFVRQMPALLSRRVPYFETFKGFLPSTTLKDVLAGTRKVAGKRTLVPYGKADLGGRGHLVDVNSKLRLSDFVPPQPRVSTFKGALLQSPIFVAVALCLASFVIWQSVVAIGDWRRLRLDRAEAEAAAELGSREAEERARVTAADTQKAAEASDCIDAISSLKAADYAACLQKYETSVPEGVRYASLVARRDARINLQHRAVDAASLWRRLSDALGPAERAPSPQAAAAMRDLLSQVKTIGVTASDEQRPLLDRAGVIVRALEESEARRQDLGTAAIHWRQRTGVEFDDFAKIRRAISPYDRAAFSADDESAWATLDSAHQLVAWSKRALTDANKAQLPIAIVERNPADVDYGLLRAIADSLAADGFGTIVTQAENAAVLIELTDIRRRSDDSGEQTRKHAGYDEEMYNVKVSFDLRLTWIGARGSPPKKMAAAETDTVKEATAAAVAKTVAASVAAVERFTRRPPP